MKKILFFVVAIVATMFATSCQKELLNSPAEGENAVVSLTVGLSDVVSTRAIGEAKMVNQLTYSVFDAAGAVLYHKTEATGFPAKVEISLAKGQTYNIVCWAQHKYCGAYSLSEDMNLTVDYAGANNDEKRDAFFGSKGFSVSGNTDVTVTLKRPFAQLNVGVTQAEWDMAEASNITVRKSSVSISNAASKMDLKTGKVTETTTVEYTADLIPAETLKITTKNAEGAETETTTTEYKYLSMSYLLADDLESADGAGKTLLNTVAFSFIPVSGDPIPFSEGLNNIPVARNWRTNIIGKILTGKTTFNIIIEEDFITPDDKPIVITEIPTNEALAAAFAAVEGDNPAQNLTAAPVVTEIPLPAAYTSENTDNSAFNMEYTDAPETVNVTEYGYDGNVAVSQDSKGFVGISSPAGQINEMNIATPSLTAKVQNTETDLLAIDKLTSHTANQTLYLGNNILVNTLIVKGGHLVIAAEVKAVESQTSETVYYLAQEGAKLPETMPANFVQVGSLHEIDLRETMLKGGEFTLEHDINAVKKFELKEGTFTLNLNGHSLIVDNAEQDAFEIHGGKLTINGEGRVEAHGTGSAYAIVSRGGETVLNGGNYLSKNAGTSCVYAKGGVAKVYINGGYYKVGGPYGERYFVLNLSDKSGASIVVKGGTFENFNPADAKTEPENPFSMLAEGYESVQIEGTNNYKVIGSYTIDADGNYAINTVKGLRWFAKAVKKTFSKKTVYLTADMDLAGENWEAVNMDGAGNFVFDGKGHTIKNLSAINPLKYGNGFFSNLYSGQTIKNVIFDNAFVSYYESPAYAGNVYGIVSAYAYGNVTFENVHVNNSFIAGYGKIGGILGMAAEPGKTVTAMKNCSVNNTKIAGIYNTAGLIGLTQNVVELSNCSSTAKWLSHSSQTYVELDTVGTYTENEETKTVEVKNGIWWEYKGEDYLCYYAAWSNLYNDYYYANKDAVLASGGYFDGLCHN